MGINVMVTIAISLLISLNFVLGISFSLIYGAVLVVLLIKCIRSKAKLHIIFTFGLCVFLFLTTSVNTGVTVSNWSFDYTKGTSYNIKGTVESIARVDTGFDIILKDLEIDGIKRAGNTLVEYAADYYAPQIIDQGFKLILYENIYSVKLITVNGVNANNYRQNIRYIVSTDGESAIIRYGEKDFFQTVRSFIYSVLNENLDSDTSSILYGMITGDKSYMQFGVANAYSAAGIGHIMAVSGLHIGFICTILILIFNVFSVRKKISRPIIIGILLLYAALVGFTPSVMRAVVMSAILLIIDIFGYQKDALNNLFFAITVILAFRPLLMFEVGFLLSCSAIFAVALFYKPIKSFFKKLYFPGALASSISIVVSAQLGVLPCMMFFFNSIQIYSLLINFLLMPLISLVFYLAVLGILLAAIYSPLGWITKLSGLGLSAIDTVTQTASKWQNAEFLVFSTFSVLLAFILYFIISEKVLFKKHKKKISLICVSICFFTIFFNIGFENKKDINLIIPIYASQDVTSLLKLDDKNILIGDINDFYSIKEVLIQHKIKKIDEVYTYSLTPVNIKNISFTCNTFNVNTLYLNSEINSETSNINSLYLKNTKIFTYEHATKMNDITAYSSNEGEFLMFNNSELNILFSSYKSRYGKLKPEIIDLVDFVRCYSFSGDYAKRFFITNYIRSDVNENPDFIIDARSYDFLAINYKNGKISKKI